MRVDVKSKHIEASGQIIQGHGRLCGIVACYKTGATGGMKLYDNDEASGEVILEFTETPEGTVVVPIPGTGILFDIGVTAIIPDNTTLTIFYSE